MTTSLIRFNRRPPAPAGAMRRNVSETSAFTLVEVIIGSTLGAFILVGVLSTFLMLGRSGTNIVSYTTMDVQARRALEEFAQDVRMANNVHWNSASSITLTVPDNYASTSNQVTYAWDSTPGSVSFGCFYRMPGDASATNAKTIYIRKITSFAYSRFDRLNAAIDDTVVIDTTTKRVQIAMTVTSTAQTVASATDNVVSASYILRDKPAS